MIKFAAPSAKAQPQLRGRGYRIDLIATLSLLAKSVDVMFNPAFAAIQ
jgi:hypothetical protein